MTDDNTGRDRLHRAMHRIPGVPDHDRAQELNGNRSGRARAKRWNTAVNEAGARAAARRHATPPRVLVGVQEFIARLLGQGE